ncbi:MAG: two-component sensor histidine kinase, partial [Anaerolineaceae bacterium]|nr:two-component sensor histidine kinase [Anaerolineaceae bacterium]
MRSISFKLIAAFLAVSLVGAAIAVVLAQMFTRSEFDRFVIDRSRNDYVESLTLYYETYGSWQG